MLTKDLKKTGLFISGLLTLFFEALSNLLHDLVWRQILNPISILAAVGIATFVIHKIKQHCNNLIIKNNEDRIKEISSPDEIEKLRDENFRLRKENSKILLLF